MSNLLAGKTVFVVGGAGLLGQAFCNAICAQSGAVVIGDLDVASANKMLGGLSADSSSVSIDVTDKSSIVAAIEASKARHGRIDAVVIAAYPRTKSYGRKLDDVTYEDFCSNLGMHLGGYFLVAQQFSQFFRQQGWGNIVTIASVYGVIAPRFEIYDGTEMTMPVEYAAIKSGVIHLTRYFAKFLKGSGVRANSLSPGGISDGQAPTFVQNYNSLCLSKGMLDRDDMGGALVFLLSDLSQYMNGQNLIVDDGFTL